MNASKKQVSLSLGQRQIISYVAILALMSILTTISVVLVNQINTSFTQITDINGVKQRYAINLGGSVQDRAIAVRDMALVASQDEVDATVAIINEQAAIYAEAAQGMAEILSAEQTSSDEEQQLFAEIQAIEERAAPIIEKVVGLRKAGEFSSTINLINAEAAPAFADWRASIDALIEHEEAKSQLISVSARTVASNFSIVMIGMLVASLAISIVLIIWNIRAIAPLRGLTTGMLEIAEGKLDTAIPEITRRDEVGDIVTAVKVFQKNAIERREMRAKEAELQRAQAQRSELMEKLTKNFENTTGDLLADVGMALEKLRNSASTLGRTAETSKARASDAASVVSEVAHNAESVASAAEELTASVYEVSQRIAQSRETMSRAQNEANSTNEKMSVLETSADKIGEVVKLITDIAGQTNLLALNATIEAARAGDAGKGFAVVANEVKNLASQTARATDEISEQIATVQSETRDAVAAIREIVETIGVINDDTAGIADSINQQSNTTTEISSKISNVAQNTRDVASNIQQAMDAADETDAASGDVRAATASMEERAQKLDHSVKQFLHDIA
eukprot:TRINITY_DN1609_c0_g6_i1.p2 TRINITY_DN1609_c0_g6~~TRINITY_DN1609_c0_g6_i1.p2  ORF type:complete len:568 (+),score=143.07 TRINITY_DN1609_c0_g6_i1:1676-3379(+)